MQKYEIFRELASDQTNQKHSKDQTFIVIKYHPYHLVWQEIFTIKYII